MINSEASSVSYLPNLGCLSLGPVVCVRCSPTSSSLKVTYLTSRRAMNMGSIYSRRSLTIFFSKENVAPPATKARPDPYLSTIRILGPVGNISNPDIFPARKYSPEVGYPYEFTELDVRPTRDSIELFDKRIPSRSYSPSRPTGAPVTKN